MDLGEEVGIEEVEPGIIIPVEWPEDAPLEPQVIPEREPVPA